MHELLRARTVPQYQELPRISPSRNQGSNVIGSGQQNVTLQVASETAPILSGIRFALLVQDK